MRDLILGLVLILAAPAAVVSAQSQPTPIEIHMSHMLAGSGEWRTPNADFDPDTPGSIAQFGADYRTSPDRSHVIAEITGLTGDGRRAVYWTIYFFYNPVLEEVVSQQIGWNGAYLEGREEYTGVLLGPGETRVSDQLHFNPDGSVFISRHEIRLVEAGTHTTQTYDRAEDGSWQPRNFRTWTLAEAD